METSLPNYIYLQLKFYTFKMNHAKSINENVDNFLKLIADLTIWVFMCQMKSKLSAPKLIITPQVLSAK